MKIKHFSEAVAKLQPAGKEYVDALLTSTIATQTYERECARKREEQLRRELSRPMTLK